MIRQNQTIIPLYGLGVGSLLVMNAVETDFLNYCSVCQVVTNDSFPDIDWIDELDSDFSVFNRTTVVAEGR